MEIQEQIKEIHKEIFCDGCNKLITRQFRFTDWYDETQDVYGSFECCLNWFNKAVEENPEGRYSIYAVTICEDCDSMLEDEGVLFNDGCPEYNNKYRRIGR